MATKKNLMSVALESIGDLFSKRATNFLIPEYQRPYSWKEELCETLWNDIKEFVFPDDDETKFDESRAEYYLGAFVTHRNEAGILEVVDGQQRITTLMLLLRAFYDNIDPSKDAASKNTPNKIERCIWNRDECDIIDYDKLKLEKKDLMVSSDDLSIILRDLDYKVPDRKEKIEKMKSQYAINYRYFVAKIRELEETDYKRLCLFVGRLLEYCIVLPIEANSQDMALTVFATLNDRGLSLADSDIFKAQLYNFYSKSSKIGDFIDKWKILEEICNDVKSFDSKSKPNTDEIFNRYMFFERAKLGMTNTTTVAIRKFYEQEPKSKPGSYKLLQNNTILDNLISLSNFWKNVEESLADSTSPIFSTDVKNKLFILNHAPKKMWTYITSVYFMQNKKIDDTLDDKPFSDFLSKIIGFILAYTLEHPGESSLRSPLYSEMIKIVQGKTVDFENNKFEEKQLKIQFEANASKIEKSILFWWAFEKGSVLKYNMQYDIEHIFAKNRAQKDPSCKTPTLEENIEKLGNKAILEKQINITASDYQFADKAKIYTFTNANPKQKYKAPTQNEELINLAHTKSDFTEADILARNEEIIDGFINYLRTLNLMK
ncbi:MAG: DUF262 domain-containing protein [Clostridia bacterium]|mgnify:CR=1 FL=1|nr:DUF262 domain-containing protein [Clostridia bacterium]